MSFAEIVTNIYVWIGATLLLSLFCMGLFLLLLFLSKKTHAIIELKAMLKKAPISLFFRDDRFCEWKVIKPECGIIEDKNYGSFIINEKGSYVDRKTKAVLLPFDANFAASLNIKACALADNIKMLVQDQDELTKLQVAVMTNQFTDNSVNMLKTSINLGSIKSMLNAMIPHAITAKVNMMIAAKMKGFGKVNVWELVLIFVAIFSAILMGYLIIKNVSG